MITTEKYSIKDLENLSGIKAHTLRIWEKRYGIVKPARTDTKIRYYSNDDLRHILNVSLLNKNGHKISYIASMSATEVTGYLAGLASVKDSVDGIHESLTLSLIDLDEALFNQTFKAAVKQSGFEQTFTGLIFPFLEKIGIMWQAGTINPAQEHFFSNIIRQKLIAATDGLEVIAKAPAKTVLLLLPENELHEIALLFYNYVLRARGFKTIYLGQSVPLNALGKIMAVCKPDYVITGMTSAMNPLSFADVARELSALLPNKPIFYTGPLSRTLFKEMPDNLLSIKELREMLSL